MLVILFHFGVKGGFGVSVDVVEVSLWVGGEFPQCVGCNDCGVKHNVDVLSEGARMNVIVWSQLRVAYGLGRLPSGLNVGLLAVFVQSFGDSVVSGGENGFAFETVKGMGSSRFAASSAVPECVMACWLLWIRGTVQLVLACFLERMYVDIPIKLNMCVEPSGG